MLFQYTEYMKLLEYEAKALLRQAAVPTPESSLLVDWSAPTTLHLPAVIKSQVPIGGRGKAGGVRIAQSREELSRDIRDIFALSIGGFTPLALLCEEVLAINCELYILLTINRATETIDLIAHPDGGMEIESHDSQEFFKRHLTVADFNTIGDELADYYDLPEKAFMLGELAEKLYNCFITNDATLLEINPLILTDDGKLIAGDCKMELDDAASFRHPEWDFETKVSSTNFVTLNPEGTVATIANGAGLAMATVDAVTATGLQPANFLDIGGSATTANIVASFQRISEFPRVNEIVINIFGGIVQCDTVAQAIIEAKATFPSLPRLFIRLSGNHRDEAAAMLAHENLPLYDSLEACIKELTA